MRMTTEEQRANPTAKFALTVQKDEGKVLMSLEPNFTVEDWDGVEAQSRGHLAEGRVHWRVDLCQLKQCDSRLMGLLIGLNAILDTRGGTLELLTRHDSLVAQALKHARLERIMTVTFA
jgi:ABC-type transporter Mla MlaB component